MTQHSSEVDLTVPDGWNELPRGLSFKHEPYKKWEVVTMFFVGTEIKACRIEPKIGQTIPEAIEHAKQTLLYWLSEELKKVDARDT